MKDLIVRLASMKLAELKFDVEVAIHSPREHESYTNTLSIQGIKKRISNFFMKTDVDDYEIEAVINQDIREDYWVAEIYQHIKSKDQYREVLVYKPDSMSLNTFEKIISSVGLLDKRKLEKLIK